MARRGATQTLQAFSSLNKVIPKPRPTDARMNRQPASHTLIDSGIVSSSRDRSPARLLCISRTKKLTAHNVEYF